MSLILGKQKVSQHYQYFLQVDRPTLHVNTWFKAYTKSIVKCLQQMCGRILQAPSKVYWITLCENKVVYRPCNCYNCVLYLNIHTGRKCKCSIESVVYQLKIVWNFAWFTHDGTMSHLHTSCILQTEQPERKVAWNQTSCNILAVEYIPCPFCSVWSRKYGNLL